MKEDRKPLIAVMTNNDDDIYCFRRELIQAIKDKGYDVLISCPDGPKFELMQDIEYFYDDPPIDRRGTNIVSDTKLLAHYHNIFMKYKPDIALTYTVKPNIYGTFAARCHGVKVINNVTGFGSIGDNNNPVYKLVMNMFKGAFRLSSCVMFQNSFNMEFAQKTGLVSGYHRLLPGSGVNVDNFSLQPYPDGGDGKTGEPVVFNYIGRILHDKGVDDLIEAAKRIKKDYPNTVFNLMGFIEPTEIHYEEDLKRLEEEGIVHYLGSLKDVRPQIGLSHATIHPSTYGEGMSNVLLESASSGRPIISTDNPGCRETFVDGVSGFCYHGGDVDGLTQAIKTFLSTDNGQRKIMGENGRKYIVSNFSREFVVNAYMEEIDKLLKEDGKIR